MRVSAIIEARMGSSRLPGKVLMDMDGWPAIAIMIQRVMMAELIDTVILATPDTNGNEPLWEFAEKAPPVILTKGPEDDVLARVLDAAESTKTDVIVELTGDCPIIDPRLIDLCTGYFLCGDYDYVGNTAPLSWPRGMDVRVFKTDALRRIHEAVKGDAREVYWREHVSPYLYETGQFKTRNMQAPEGEAFPTLNLSVDTREDYRRVRDIVETLRKGNPAFSIKDIVTYLASLPGYEQLAGPLMEEKPASWLLS